MAATTGKVGYRTLLKKYFKNKFLFKEFDLKFIKKKKKIIITNVNVYLYYIVKLNMFILINATLSFKVNKIENTASSIKCKSSSVSVSLN